MKKLLSLLLALTLVFSLAVTAFAAEGGDNGETEPATTPVTGTNDNNGKITIDNAVVGQTYTIYELLTLESYNTTTDSYAYKATTAWEAWLKTQTSYVTVNDKGFVTWVAGADAAAFAKAAKAHAKTNNIANNGSKNATTTTVVFENLNLGYYLVDSTLGTLCSLDTTNKEVTIKEKNAVPSNEKKVQEDKDSQWYDHNDADIGQTVNFQSTITAQAGAENYVFHDKMSEGLTYGSVSGITLNGTQIASNTHTIVSTGLSDGCTFHVEFAQDFCDTLKANDQIVISYTATLNDKAVVGLTGNPNESKLSYGDESTTSTNVTPPSKTITYTWDMDVLKYANGNKDTKLAGVKFVLIKKETSGSTTTEYVAKFDANKKLTWVAVPAAGTDNKITWPTESILTTDANGKIEIDGLDADTYYLREIETLPGYNMIEDVQVVITGATTPEGSDTPTYSTKLVEVNNNSGTELPSTGGAGTTLFYVLGSVLVLAAVVLLVTKKRMSAEG